MIKYVWDWSNQIESEVLYDRFEDYNVVVYICMYVWLFLSESTLPISDFDYYNFQDLKVFNFEPSVLEMHTYMT